jgi:hypothetical protein
LVVATLKMHRAAADDGEAAAAAAAAEKVAPLLQLKHAAVRVSNLGRLARAVELYERVVAEAEATLPRNSLVTASCLGDAKSARFECASAALRDGNNALKSGDFEATWSRDEHILLLSQRCMSLCHDRFRAGTLFTLTPEELAFFAGAWIPAALQGAVAFWTCAHDAASFWPPTHTRAEEETRLHAIYDALRAALDVEPRGLLHGGGAPAGAQLTPIVSAAIARELLVRFVLNDDVGGGLLEQLRRVCGLTRVEEEALRRMVDWNCGPQAWSPHLQATLAGQQQRAAADVARHGLRACALPECAQTEPHPKAFKVCGRCRAGLYCSAAHQAEDWRRHKRADGCKATAEGQ